MHGDVEMGSLAGDMSLYLAKLDPSPAPELSYLTRSVPEIGRASILEVQSRSSESELSIDDLERERET